LLAAFTGWRNWIAPRQLSRQFLRRNSELWMPC